MAGVSEIYGHSPIVTKAIHPDQNSQRGFPWKTSFKPDTRPNLQHMQGTNSNSDADCNEWEIFYQGLI